jgi:hypothetical protein
MEKCEATTVKEMLRKILASASSISICQCQEVKVFFFLDFLMKQINVSN